MYRVTLAGRDPRIAGGDDRGRSELRPDKPRPTGRGSKQIPRSLRKRADAENQETPALAGASCRQSKDRVTEPSYPGGLRRPTTFTLN